MNLHRRFALFVLCTSATLMLASLAAAQTYSITDLGTFPGGTVSQGEAVNQHGLVAGYARNEAYNAHGFLWTAAQGLRTLPSIPPQSNFAIAQAINCFGETAGYSDYDELENEHAVIWIGQTLVDLGTLPGGTISEATGINDDRHVTGFSDGTDISPHAFVWNSTQGMEDLGTLPGGYYSQGLAINGSSQVAGFSNAADGQWHAFLWSRATGMVALPNVPGATSASANAINGLGQVAGGSGSYAVIWDASGQKVQSLGTLQGQTWSTAFGINNKGQVIGWSGYTAFVWTREGGMQDLNDLIPPDSGWSLTLPVGINDDGQITGQGNINGEEHGFLLTPVVAAK